MRPVPTTEAECDVLEWPASEVTELFELGVAGAGWERKFVGR